MSELSIEAVLSHYDGNPPIGRHGWVSMRCPFHNDHTASARVNTDLGAFKCLCCGASAGSALGLVMNREHLDRGAAIEYVTKEIGADISPLSQSVHQSSRQRRRNRQGWKRVSSRSWD